MEQKRETINEKELKILEFWKKDKTFEKSLEKRREGIRFLRRTSFCDRSSTLWTYFSIYRKRRHPKILDHEWKVCKKSMGVGLSWTSN